MKIGFISPFQGLTELVKSISTDMGVRVDVFEAVFEAGAKIVKRLEEEKYDILISRGATYYSISKMAKIPVINCGVTSFDILYALYEASKISKNVGLIIYEPIPLNYELISEILQIKLTYLTSYKNTEELQKMVEDTIKNGVDVIVGGILTIQFAKELGRPGVLLRTSEETIRQAIKNAVEIINLTRKQQLEAERLKQLVNFSYDGIILTDSQGVVTVFNPAAEEILGIKANDILNNRAEEFIPTTGLIEVAKTGEVQLGRLQKVKNTTIITNRIPIKVRDEVLGVVATFQDIGKIQDWEMKIRSELSQKGLVAKYTFNNYVGSSETVKKMLLKAQRFTKSDSTVLITGESGTGKEILAQSIHNASNRKDYPFVAVNCTAIPEHLLESELFGYEEGAFTGARKGGKVGLFELAHRGTIFLDELGSISKNLQSNLLRVLQEREVWRLGSNKVVQIDVRVIAATNSDLQEAVERGEFRSDLFYRLNVLNLQTVPLRERKEDIIELLHYFIKSQGGKPILLNKETENLLKEYFWPGNVRELQNFAERLLLLKDEIPMAEVFHEMIDRNAKYNSRAWHKEEQDTLRIKKGTLRDMEKTIIRQMYRDYQENATLLAERLRISRTTLWKKLKENEETNN